MRDSKREKDKIKAIWATKEEYPIKLFIYGGNWCVNWYGALCQVQYDPIAPKN